MGHKCVPTFCTCTNKTLNIFSCLQESEYEEYVALADYQPMDSNEIPLSEGDIVELRKIGSDGWWFVRHVVTGEEGWAPASYLESVKRRSSHSTLSMSSLGKVLTACVFLHSRCAHSLQFTHSTWLWIMVIHLLLLCGRILSPRFLFVLNTHNTIDYINNSLATMHLCSGNASHVSTYMIG